jgi:hypothetical protein
MYNNTAITALVKYADISLFLGADEYEIEKYYNWVDETERLEMIYILRDVIAYYQPYYQALLVQIQVYEPTYQGNASYQKLISLLYAYIGKWMASAAIISNNPNGIVTGLPVTPLPPSPVIITNVTVTNKEYTATGGETYINWTDMIGRTCVYVSRGGVDMQNIITSGTPSVNQVLWNSTTGRLTFNGGLDTGEFVRGLFN